MGHNVRPHVRMPSSIRAPRDIGLIQGAPTRSTGGIATASKLRSFLLAPADVVLRLVRTELVVDRHCIKFLVVE